MTSPAITRPKRRRPTATATAIIHGTIVPFLGDPLNNVDKTKSSGRNNIPPVAVCSNPKGRMTLTLAMLENSATSLSSKISENTICYMKNWHIEYYCYSICKIELQQQLSSNLLRPLKYVGV